MIAASNYASSVYIATDDRGWCKVGHTTNPRIRAYHLSRDRGCAVRMVHVEPERPRAEIVETVAHWLLADFESHGEWFRTDEQTARAALAEALAKVSDGHVPHAPFWTGMRKSLAADLDTRARAALLPGETITALIREAVERELERRERGEG